MAWMLATTAQHDLAAAIPRRRTDRRRFSPWPVPAELIGEMLATVDRERLVGLRAAGSADQQRLPGGAPATPPAQQPFWVATATGPGVQQLNWTATEGRWAAAVMNADGSRPVVADLSAAATAPGLRWVWIGLYLGAGVSIAAGITLVLLGARRSRPAPLPSETP